MADRLGRLPDVPWGLRSVALAVVALVVFAGVVVLGGAGLLRLVSGGTLAGDGQAQLTAFSTLGVLVYLGMLALVWFFAIRRARGNVLDLGFRPFNPLYGVALALGFQLFGLLLVAAFVLTLRAIGAGALVPGEQVPDFARQGSGVTVFVVLAAILAPIAEEAFFRGFVLPPASRALGLAGGLVLSSLLFALAHVQLTSIGPTFLLGLLLGSLYRITGSIWPSILMHGANNALAVAVALRAPLS